MLLLTFVCGLSCLLRIIHRTLYHLFTSASARKPFEYQWNFNCSVNCSCFCALFFFQHEGLNSTSKSSPGMKIWWENAESYQQSSIVKFKVVKAKKNSVKLKNIHYTLGLFNYIFIYPTKPPKFPEINKSALDLSFLNGFNDGHDLSLIRTKHFL